jgi:hypothetical protein
MLVHSFFFFFLKFDFRKIHYGVGSGVGSSVSKMLLRSRKADMLGTNNKGLFGSSG